MGVKSLQFDALGHSHAILFHIFLDHGHWNPELAVDDVCMLYVLSFQLLGRPDSIVHKRQELDGQEFTFPIPILELPRRRICGFGR